MLDIFNFFNFFSFLSFFFLFSFFFWLWGLLRGGGSTSATFPLDIPQISQ